MADVTELKQFVVVHAKGQKLRGYRELLARIDNDDTGPGSWVEEWSRAADGYERRGRLLDATRHYAMARFPYVDGPARERALERCVSAFERWRVASAGHIESLVVDLPGGPVRCWATGLSTTDRRPLVLITGGIVTAKEQWAPALSLYRRLGLAAIATEMPGVDENPLPYGRDSWRMLTGLLDAVADRADVSRTYATALSFSGHLALRAAVEDRRIRGVVTTGAPVHEFFTDVDWQRRLPRITVDTLAHLTGTKSADIPGSMRDWALTADQLASLDIPIGYVASRRDEIIPAGDVRFLRAHARQVEVLEHDDVHGSPGHVAATQVWSLRSLLAMSGAGGGYRRLVDLLWLLRR